MKKFFASLANLVVQANGVLAEVRIVNTSPNALSVFVNWYRGKGINYS